MVTETNAAPPNKDLTIELVSTLSQLKISDETLGKLIREAVLPSTEAGNLAGNKAIGVHNKDEVHKDDHKDHNKSTENTIKDIYGKGNNYGDKSAHKAKGKRSVIVEFRREGKRSTASIPTELYDLMLPVIGTDADFKQKVRDFVAEMPSDSDENVSTYVQDKLKQLLNTADN